ncbi:hypothetical protein [Streptomyces sp. NPDC006270]|uniref:hypothetical protein n=1 Tax=Streptomyces sp. NPDC006270 TaxID=3364741 RepID=UPI0036965499
MYQCVTSGCATVRAPVPAIDRELRALAVRRFARPGFVTRWRRARLAELDAEIAEAHAVRAYCRDPRHRIEVALELGGRRRRFSSRVDDERLLWRLSLLNERAVWLVTQRAELSRALDREPAPDGAARLAELKRVLSQHSFQSRHGPWQRDGLAARMFGTVERREALSAVLEEQLWALLGRTDWQDAVAAPSPAEDDALAMDWGESPHTMTGRRRALLEAAVGGDRLVLEAEEEGVAVLVVIPAGGPLGEPTTGEKAQRRQPRGTRRRRG